MKLTSDRHPAFNPLNAELNPTCHLLALLGGATIVVVSRLRVKLRVRRPESIHVPIRVGAKFRTAKDLLVLWRQGAGKGGLT
jgi:hypothetical protein